MLLFVSDCLQVTDRDRCSVSCARAKPYQVNPFLIAIYLGVSTHGFFGCAVHALVLSTLQWAQHMANILLHPPFCYWSAIVYRMCTLCIVHWMTAG